MGDEHLKFREHPQDFDSQRGVPLGNSLIFENVNFSTFWPHLFREGHEKVNQCLPPGIAFPERAFCFLSSRGRRTAEPCAVQGVGGRGDSVESQQSSFGHCRTHLEAVSIPSFLKM